MHAIRIHTKVDSETLHLPELKPFVGKKVEIIILEEVPSVSSETELHPYDALYELAGNDVVDPEAYKKLRAASMI